VYQKPSRAMFVTKTDWSLEGEILRITDSFVRNHEYGNIFQSTGLFKFHGKVTNRDPFVITVYEKEDLVGTLFSVIQKEAGLLRRYFSRRCIVEGGCKLCHFPY